MAVKNILTQNQSSLYLGWQIESSSLVIVKLESYFPHIIIGGLWFYSHTLHSYLGQIFYHYFSWFLIGAAIDGRIFSKKYIIMNKQKLI